VTAFEGNDRKITTRRAGEVQSFIVPLSSLSLDVTAIQTTQGSILAVV
jgi:hypothetical protein